MSDTNKAQCESEIRKYAGEDSEEIIEAVHKLAKVDVHIKDALDEIEEIDHDLCAEHNKLAGEINEMIRKVTGQKEEEEKQEAKEPDTKANPAPEIPAKHVTVEVHLMRVPPIPLPLFLLMELLNS